VTISPLRKLGHFGVNTDTDPFDLPLGTFTFAANARFEDNRISRGPVCGFVGSFSNQSNNPEYVIAYRQSSGAARMLIAKQDGTVNDYTPGGSETDISASGWSPAGFSQAYTGTAINDVVYLNRPDRVPWFMLKGGTSFAPLTNWNTNWRCQSLRSFNGQLVALNVTKAGVSYPTMVAWSDFTVWQAVPGTWTAGTTNSAGSNVLSDLGDPLVDGLALRNTFVLYSNNETWSMTPTGGSDVFSFNRLFNGWGLLSQNCVAEVNNVHYVFGYDKIWRHDGFTPQDISSGRVKNFIYEQMDKANAWQFFTVHMPRRSEVMFCYRSIDPYCAFKINDANNYQGCNKAAVYNYRADTWYFYDLPYVTSAGFMTPSAATTYTGLGSITYTTIGGSYSTYGDTSKLVFYFVSNAAPSYGITAGVRSFELPGTVYVTGTIGTNSSPSVALYISQMALDELGADIRGYKVLKSIYPEGRLAPNSVPMQFYFSASDYPNVPAPQYDDPMTFDGGSLYQLDYMTAGRFLGLKIIHNDVTQFSLSGLDVDFQVTGHR